MSGTPHELPADLDAPTIRALVGAGYTKLSDLADATEVEILELHGMGPKVVAKLKRLLASEGVTFADDGGADDR